MDSTTKAVVIAAGLGAAAYVLYRGVPAVSAAVGGILTGDNALTRGATNGAGERTTAYQGAGVVGSLGAAANAASGGWFASLGEWAGGKAYDLTHPEESAPPITAAQAAAYQSGLDLTNGAGATFPLGQIISVGM